MGESGICFGLGAKDLHPVFVFHDRNPMKTFIQSGWAFGTHADAAAKGGVVGEEILLDDVTIYQITESGLALQATVTEPNAGSTVR